MWRTAVEVRQSDELFAAIDLVGRIDSFAFGF